MIISIVITTFVIVATCGAYAAVMSSNYNARPDAKEIMVHNNQDYLMDSKDKVPTCLASSNCETTKSL